MEALFSSLYKMLLFFDKIRLVIFSRIDPLVFELLEYVVLILFCIAALMQLWYYWFVFRKPASYNTSTTMAVQPPASIIICAKNEEFNLTRFLPLVLAQNYPDYEVIVVNDCSYDNTHDILEEFAKKHQHLKIVTIKEDDNYRHGKKFALMCGIKGAKHEHLLFTDADCYPKSNNWLSNMMRNYSDDNTAIVLGYGAYEKSNGFLNKLIRFDTFYVALQYLSFSLAGKTYMGVGRNLSYRKSLFYKQKGFASHYFIKSGDDDLFVNQAATALNTKVDLDIESVTLSKPKTTLKEWFHQKRRHITTYKYYKPASLRRLTLLSGSQYAFWILFIVALIAQYQPYIVLSAFGLRFISQLIIFKKTMNKLNESDLLLFSPLFELLLLFIYPALSFSNSLIKDNKWKS